MQATVENNKPMNITIEPLPVHTTLTQEELFRGVTLSEKVESLESLKKELEDTMQEMEREADDMNQTIEQYQQRNQELEKENEQLRLTVQQLRRQKQSQWSLKPLGNPFNGSICREDEMEALKRAKEEVAASLKLEEEKNTMLLARLEELQQIISHLPERSAEVVQNGSRTRLLAQLTLFKLKEANLLNTLQKVKMSKKNYH